MILYEFVCLTQLCTIRACYFYHCSVLLSFEQVCVYGGTGCGGKPIERQIILYRYLEGIFDICVYFKIRNVRKDCQFNDLEWNISY